MRLVTLAFAIPVMAVGAAHAERDGPVEQNPRDLFATALPFCQMMWEPRKYVGRETAVSGLYASTPHGGMIYGRECPNEAIFLRGSAGDDSPEVKAVFADAFRNNEFARVPVVVIGVLRKPWRYQLEQVRFVAALRPGEGEVGAK